MFVLTPEGKQKAEKNIYLARQRELPCVVNLPTGHRDKVRSI